MRDAHNADAGRAPGEFPGGHIRQNLLEREPSAYLRQHAGNPVHWRPFGDEAFAEAAARDVPVFLSIGYAACHWCHVMAHESFEDQETADYLNEHFVAVKVDREERPDVDSVYMAATQAISGEGGWPMSVFLTADGRAFHAGTYFPPRPMPGRPSFRQVLEAVWEAWQERRDAVEQNAQTLAQSMGEAQLTAAVRLEGTPPLVDSLLLPGAVESLARTEDQHDGGFGAAPKFPPSAVLEFLLRHAAVPHDAVQSDPARSEGAQSKAAQPDPDPSGPGPSDTAHSDTADAAGSMAGRTLAAMARSALFDQLDGGFARYSVTRDWSVPHFEKMLYDNAQLLRVYVHWIRLGGNEDFPAGEAAEVAARTAEWMLDSLGLPDAGSAEGAGAQEPRVAALASSLDADSVVDGEHHEGATYLWTINALQDVLGPDAGAAVAQLMNVGPEGTVSEFGSPLHPARALTATEAKLWDQARPALLAARRLRPQPARDEKIVAGWNGLAVAALAEAGAVLDRRDFVSAAESIAAYLERVHWQPSPPAPISGQEDPAHVPPLLMRVSHAGTARGIGGLLGDYAFCAEGMFALYAVSGQPYWYGFAEQLVQAACSRFVVSGRLVDTSEGAAQVSSAQGGQSGLEPYDGATPSGASAFAGVLLSYAALSGSAEHRAMAGHILSLLPPLAVRAPGAVGWLLATAQAALAGPVEAAVVGPDSPERTALHRELLNSPSPGLVIAVGDDGGGPASPSGTPSGDVQVPLLAGRAGGPGGTPLVYLCRNMVCEMPVSSVAELRRRLAAMTVPGPGGVL
ncbi:thioredoxin domain-containing protein [Arthrobacter sp. CDRTa11]|uniref:thioredoxin domain-containing protein n=1 Tax=Arthrobacter sp. CDRTa11 TaxID=2651199 RepID=UPI002265F9C9|nr:thioredoxin domain-containing protein [Arthrobacter sp. CDRTa11]UZX02352.1 thioredoxin domain-containing protein [Arthrobacter sp. CDRTa11]